MLSFDWSIRVRFRVCLPEFPPSLYYSNFSTDEVMLSPRNQGKTLFSMFQFIRAQKVMEIILGLYLNNNFSWLASKYGSEQPGIGQKFLIIIRQCLSDWTCHARVNLNKVDTRRVFFRSWPVVVVSSGRWASGKLRMGPFLVPFSLISRCDCKSYFFNSIQSQWNEDVVVPSLERHPQVLWPNG